MYESPCEYKPYVVGVYPNALCYKTAYENGCTHYRIFDSEFKSIGFSQVSQTKAWKNAWDVITKKMKKKLEW